MQNVANNPILLSVILLSVVMLSVVMLIVEASSLYCVKSMGSCNADFSKPVACTINV